LIGALKNANARIDAANALGSIGTGAKEAIPKLQEIIEDKNTKRDKNYAMAVNDAMKKIQGNETATKKKKK
jgi:HEAT repeat protein